MSDSYSAKYQFLITDGAKEDLEKCVEEDSFAAAYIASFLQELRGDLRYLERMIDQGFSDETVENISAVWSLQNKRINAYRAKLVVLKNWRLIFIVDRRTARIGLFAIMHRDSDYEKDVQLWMDIEREFDAIGFTRY